jgi:hypothetical protein
MTTTKRMLTLVDLVAETPEDFGKAVTALVTLYNRCERRGNAGLARRAQASLAALLGPQKHLRGDDTPPVLEVDVERTLRGLG